jgi:choline-sulfatase
VHVFEPHAPYGDPRDGRPVLDRYDDEIGAANRELMRLLDAIGSGGETIVVAAGDHGEAFGEHGEHAHSIFVYDTTLRVPLVFSGRGVSARAVISEPVTLADVAPTVMRLLGFTMSNVDGVDLSPALAGGSPGARELYAESFAPLVEFGWAPLRAIRWGQWKYIAAPKAELYDISADPDEGTNLYAANETTSRDLDRRANHYSPASLHAAASGPTSDAAERLRALGYSAGGRAAASADARPDPKDRRELAARLAQVTSGELSGAALIEALEAIVREDPRNGQAHLRLGYGYLQTGDCRRAEPELRAAIGAGLPSADAFLGLAGCLGQRRDFAGAETALSEARRLEPDNPVVMANLGILKGTRGDAAGAIEALQRALALDPDLHEARFNLALTYARSGRRQQAGAVARDLLARLPLNAPQRPEVERLIKELDRQ